MGPERIVELSAKRDETPPRSGATPFPPARSITLRVVHRRRSFALRGPSAGHALMNLPTAPITTPTNANQTFSTSAATYLPARCFGWPCTCYPAVPKTPAHRSPPSLIPCRVQSTPQLHFTMNAVAGRRVTAVTSSSLGTVYSSSTFPWVAEAAAGTPPGFLLLTGTQSARAAPAPCARRRQDYRQELFYSPPRVHPPHKHLIRTNVQITAYIHNCPGVLTAQNTAILRLLR